MPKSNADRIAKLEHECVKHIRIIAGLLLRLAKLETNLATMAAGQDAQDEAINALERQAKESSK